ncbi:MAG: putative rane protein insertion efficiency factor [Cyanobacteriota bacterium]|jgi:putative component of membrane protein insertase Oxa1/YidC/SpoIIIJ protein YidD
MLKLTVKLYRHGKLKNKLKIREGCCIYQETCSAYAERIINEKGELKAFLLILQRVLLCNPIGYKTLGVNLYEKCDADKKMQSQLKANLILVIALSMILPMQLTSFFIFKELALKPISYIVKKVDS